MMGFRYCTTRAPCTSSQFPVLTNKFEIFAISYRVPGSTSPTINRVHYVFTRVFAKVRFSKCTSLKIVPKAAFAVHF